MEFNPQIQLAGLLEWMAEQMNACRGKTAVIGISGGKDSSTVAALAVAAYGRENVLGVLMPDGVQPDIDYSQALVEHLDLPHTTINIHDAVQGVLNEMEKAGLTPSRQTKVNLPSRVRMATLYAVAQSVEGGIVINTSNLSEDWVGYCTIYGDSAGAFSPLGMYTTEEVVALGRQLGLPEKFLIKPPSDGLTGLIPGSGVGNHRRAVDRAALGVPVIAVGVPTVIDGATLCADLLEEAGRPQQDLSGRGADLFVTPQDIDQRVTELGRIVGYGITLALQRGLTLEDVTGLLG